MGKKKSIFVKIIRFKINLDHLVMIMVLCFTSGAAMGAGALYYGQKLERDRHKAALYYADEFVESTENEPQYISMSMRF